MLCPAKADEASKGKMVTIATLADLSNFLKSRGSTTLAFRGQENSSWGLIPSIFRGIDSGDVQGYEEEIERLERDIIREFDRKARGAPGFDPTQSVWHRLALAQHYGTPTRMLDWTSNPLNALYFAACAAPQEEGAVWWAEPAKLAIPANLGRLHNSLGLRVAQVEEYVTETKLSFALPVSIPTTTFSSQPTPTPRLNFDQNGSDELAGILTFLLMEDSNPRMAAQAGLFSVYITDTPEEIVLDHAEYIHQVESWTGSGDFIGKLEVPASAKGELMRELEQVDRDASTIFRDLLGISEYLKRMQRRTVETIKSYP